MSLICETKYLKKVLLLLVLTGFLMGCTANLLYDEMSYYDKKRYDDIQYIATKKEKKTYLQLHKSKRSAYLRDFWARRDPTPDTVVNEYKIEHYRRLTYSNKYFSCAAYPGWKTDRGWSYIKYGPPDQIQRELAGYDSGGWQAPPYEIWSYDYSKDLRMGTQFYFVDRYFTGDYKRVNAMADISVNPWSESTGDEQLSRNASSVSSDISDISTFSMISQRTGTNYEFMQQRYATMEQRRFIDEVEDKSKQIDTSDDVLPEIRIFASSSKFMAEKGHMFVQFDYQIPYTDLLFLDMPDGKYRATFYIGTELQKDKNSYMVGQVQKDILVDNVEESIDPFKYFTYSTGAIIQPGEYVLRVSLRDPTSARIGYFSEKITVNSFADDFDISSIEYASKIEEIDQEKEDLFRKYDWSVLPNPSNSYPQGDDLAVYYEIYNLKLNENSIAEYITEYTIYPVDDSKNVLIYEKLQNYGPEGNIHGIQAYITQLDEEKFPPGIYKIEIRVTDLVTKKVVMNISEFTVLSRL